jgi:mannose-6-phosphate isomerase-like protein (cupin superfamily)
MEEKAIVVGPETDRWGSPMKPGRPWITISGQDTAGSWAMIESLVVPQFGPPLHFHYHQDEWFRVLEGEFLFEAGGQQYSLTKGMSILIPRLVPHRFQNTRQAVARFLGLVQPAGGFEDGFAEYLQLSEAEQAGGPLVKELLARYGTELVGPPLPARS